jgi:predicted DNA-binding protein YlxM (UPF0122 family)
MDLNSTLQTKQIRNYMETCLGIDLSFRTRKRSNVYARAVYFKLCKEYTRLSLTDIGASVNVDHATVIHGINNVFPLVMQYDGHLQDLYEDYRYSNNHDAESIFENYSRLLKENIELRDKIKDVKDSESLLDRRFIDLYNEIPKQKINDVYDKLDVIVKVAKAFHERDTVQS